GAATGVPIPEKREALGNQFEASLRSFVRLAKAWGSRPVLMTQVLVHPDGKGGFAGMIAPEQLARGDFDAASFASIQDYANAIIRQVALSEEALLIDLATARTWRHREDVYDGLHFTALGARRVADIVAGALAADMAKTGNR
ncbi:MAG: hypothetical protein VX871_01700, partial [Pseudomonadota bacterium]|nr:hypothetical protein [Pseudomonadota bacterium]